MTIQFAFRFCFIFSSALMSNILTATFLWLTHPLHPLQPWVSPRGARGRRGNDYWRHEPQLKDMWMLPFARPHSPCSWFKQRFAWVCKVRGHAWC